MSASRKYHRLLFIVIAWLATTGNTINNYPISWKNVNMASINFTGSQTSRFGVSVKVRIRFMVKLGLVIGSGSELLNRSIGPRKLHVSH